MTPVFFSSLLVQAFFFNSIIFVFNRIMQNYEVEVKNNFFFALSSATNYKLELALQIYRASQREAKIHTFLEN